MNVVDPRRRVNQLGLFASLLAIVIGGLLIIRPAILTPAAAPTPTKSSTGLNGPAGHTVETGDIAPDFELATLDGRTIKLSDLRGQPVLVNFWATWCGPCKEEVPLITAAYAQHQAAGLRVLAIDTTAFDDVQAVKKFVADYQMTFDILLDTDDAVGTGWNTLGLPSSYFIDTTGKVVSMRIGQMSEQELNDSLKMILPN
ncbi:MAG TPA: TlpA disulfide reductase family protein [Anaerolineae bacterium]|nr:TlpA disulfide reductase family protein [Anaerolineae bacterium]